jgi:hypothetical protein
LSYQLNKLHILIILFAASIMTGICIYNYIYRQITFFEMTLLVSVTIVCFYILGVFVRAYLIQRVFPPQPHWMDALDLGESDEEPVEMTEMEEMVYLTDDDDALETEQAGYAADYAEYTDTEEP